MSSSASALPALRSRLYRALAKPENLCPALVWWFLVCLQAVIAVTHPSVTSLGLVLINSVALVLFVTRRDASKVGNLTEAAIAVAGTFVLSVFLVLTGGKLGGSGLIPTMVQCVGLIGWAISLVALGRSLAIVPADRGLVRHGPYRFIRHPVYAFEALFFMGWLISVISVLNVLVIGAWCGLQVARILREERIIAGYERYRHAVRWRVLPGVW
jgi:protein-S-isoprenylcysteine O-methyltransferase Ste14